MIWHYYDQTSQGPLAAATSYSKSVASTSPDQFRVDSLLIDACHARQPLFVHIEPDGIPRALLHCVLGQVRREGRNSVWQVCSDRPRQPEGHQPYQMLRWRVVRLR